MLFPPIPLGKQLLAPDSLAEDKKHCRKIGPCGLGKKALYVNSFYLDRRYYVRYGEIRRCFKRVAMSKGGFTGKGAFGSLPYLVVQLKDGTEKQCNFKDEEQVDTLLEYLGTAHPEIPRHSEAAEKKLGRMDILSITLTFAVMLLYAVTLPYLGFILATILYLFLQFIILAPKEKRNLPLFAVIAIGFTALVFVAFRVGLSQMLPRGPIESLLGF